MLGLFAVPFFDQSYASSRPLLYAFREHSKNGWAGGKVMMTCSNSARVTKQRKSIKCGVSEVSIHTISFIYVPK